MNNKLIRDMFKYTCFEEVVRVKKTKYGFDMLVKGCTYNQLMMDFVDRINEENLADKKIIEFLIEAAGENLLVHFYAEGYFGGHSAVRNGRSPLGGTGGGRKHNLAVFQRKMLTCVRNNSAKGYSTL